MGRLSPLGTVSLVAARSVASPSCLCARRPLISLSPLPPGERGGHQLQGVTPCPALLRPPPRPRWHRRVPAKCSRPSSPTPVLPSGTAIAERREDLVQEVIANALVAFVRLVQLKKIDLAYPTVLARYAVAQISEGRRVGNRLNVNDVMSPYCQRLKGVVVERLDHFDDADEEWTQMVVEDKTAGPAEIARTRLDFAAWLKRLPPRDRRVARFLAHGPPHQRCRPQVPCQRRPDSAAPP